MKAIENVGKEFDVLYGYKARVLEYLGNSNVKIIFTDGTTDVTNIYSLKRGAVKNPNHPLIYGVGYFGQGKYKAKEQKKITKAYGCWRGLLERTYCDKLRSKHPNLLTVELCEEWHNFQVFAQWHEKNYRIGWEINNSFLRGDKNIFSPETCVFLPSQIGKLFLHSRKKATGHPLGVYFRKDKGLYTTSIKEFGKKRGLGLFKTPQEASDAYNEAKRNYTRGLAEIWKNEIDERVYLKLKLQ